jgi:multidrug efflux pump subunit AcrB
VCARTCNMIAKWDILWFNFMWLPGPQQQWPIKNTAKAWRTTYNNVLTPTLRGKRMKKPRVTFVFSFFLSVFFYKICAAGHAPDSINKELNITSDHPQDRNQSGGLSFQYKISKLLSNKDIAHYHWGGIPCGKRGPVSSWKLRIESLCHMGRLLFWYGSA